MTHRRDEDKPEAEQRLNSDLSPGGCFHPVIEQGTQVYHCTNTSNTDLGALRIILRGRPVIPKVQHGPINEGSESEQTAVATELSKEIPELAESHNSDIEKLELEEQARRAQEEAEGLRNHIAKMQSKLKEDRHTSGKASATYLNSRHDPSHPI